MVFPRSQVWASGSCAANVSIIEKKLSQAAALNWNRTLLQVIDMGSFSSLWYWIAVAVVWSTVTHRALGVPYDMIQRAKRHGGQADIDLVDMVRISVNRQLNVATVAGIWLIGLLFFLLTMLAALGFLYGIEIAQAIFLILLPLSFVAALTVSASRLIMATQPEGEALYSVLLRYRLYTQIIGMIAIFVTGLYGMFYNLAIARII